MKLSPILLVGIKALPISESDPVDVCCHRNGTIYNGKWSTTKSGAECDFWKFHERIYADETSHNYCRNPHGDTPWCYTSDDKFDECDIPTCTECTCDAHHLGECQWPRCDYENFKSICNCDEEAVLHQGVCMNRATIDEPYNDECHPGDNCGYGKCKYDDDLKLECSCDPKNARLTKDAVGGVKICEVKEKEPCTCGDDSWCRWDIDDRLVDCECPDGYFLDSLKCSLTPATTTVATTTPLPTTSTIAVTDPNPAPLPPLRPSMPGECWYKGDRNWTKSGKRCLRWDDNSQRYTESIIEQLFTVVFNQPMDHNFCRNPTGDESGPWCYVKSDDDKFVEWEECNVDQVQYCKDPAAYVERDDVKPEETTTMAQTTSANTSKCADGEVEILNECQIKPKCQRSDDTCKYGCFHFDFKGDPDRCNCMDNTEPSVDDKFVCVVSKSQIETTFTTTIVTTTERPIEDKKPIYLLTGAKNNEFNGEYHYDEETNKLRKLQEDQPIKIFYDSINSRWSIGFFEIPSSAVYFAPGAEAVEQLETLKWTDMDDIINTEMHLRRKGEDCFDEDACGYGRCEISTHIGGSWNNCICDSDAQYLQSFAACVKGIPKVIEVDRPLWDPIVPKEPISSKLSTTAQTTTLRINKHSPIYSLNQDFLNTSKNNNLHQYKQTCSKECGDHGKCIVQYGAEVCECEEGFMSFGATPCF